MRHPGRSLAALTSVVLTMSLAACGGSSLSSSSDGGGADGDGPVSIGLSVPLSGVYASLGEDMTQGFDLYLEEHGGQLGGRDVKVVKADEGEKPDTGVPATTKLVTQDKVSAVVGLVNSATALGLRDTFEGSKVPLVVANAGADGLTTPTSDYIWRTAFTNGGVGGALGAEVADEVDGGSVYLLGSDYAAGRESVGGFKKAFEAAGGKVAGETYTPFGTTSDFQPFLSKVKQSGAKAVYVFYAGAEAVAFVKQFDSFGLSKDVQLYGAGFLTEGGALAAQGASAIGVRTSLHYSDLLDNPVNGEFVKAYAAKYDEPPTTYAVQAYDAAAALDKAIETADSTSGADIAAALADVGEIDSPRGPWSFDEKHDPTQTYYLREVADVDGTLGNTILNPLGEQG